jgi:archaellum component FlaC
VHDRVRTLSPFDGHAVSEGRELSVQVGDANYIVGDENEVEMLRKRLKHIQKEREKLGFSVDQNKEADASQLRLLEEISKQLKEIKVSTETGQSSRQVPVPH